MTMNITQQAVSYQQKIITLWAVFLLGTLFHTQLGLMPLFHNQSVAISDAHETGNLALIFWLMLIFFAIPMVLMLTTLFMESKRYRKIHFGITILYSVLNFSHLIADLLVKPIMWYQIALMAMLLVVGLVINWVSWHWVKERHHSQQFQLHSMT